MHICKNCKCKLSDKTSNCPLCGARTVIDSQKDNTQYCEYLKNPYIPKNQLVRNIFLGIFTIVFLILAVICWVFIKKFDALLFYAIGAVFLWLAVFRHIFKKHRTKTILNSNSIYFLLLSLFILIIVKRIDIFVAYFLPITFCALLIIELFIALIGKKFANYCLSILILSLISLPIFLTVFLLDYKAVLPSIIFIVISCVTLVFSVVLGKNTLKTEIGKRLHM